MSDFLWDAHATSYVQKDSAWLQRRSCMRAWPRRRRSTSTANRRRLPASAGPHLWQSDECQQTEPGNRDQAARGQRQVSSQSQSGPTRLADDKNITVASEPKPVAVAACEQVLLTAQGPFLNTGVRGPMEL